MIETPEHLFQPPLYCYNKNQWTPDFNLALNNSNNEITLDLSAVLSFISFGYICNNRTLFREISRKPWLSSISQAGSIQLLEIPPHDFLYSDYARLSRRFYELLIEEARTAIKGYENVYVLLSGGLDSRIVAGILKHLKVSGEIKNEVTALTWGLEDSRDVVYARHIAKKLGIGWQHIHLTHATLLNNIHTVVDELGLAHSPELLHSMGWLNLNLPEKSIIFAGSFGDSIGRGEFGGLHLLQLKFPFPNDKFNLLNESMKNAYYPVLLEDINSLFRRSPGALPYMNYEHFMQGYRMNGGLCHALSLVKGGKHVYQMFTAPDVYRYIWSLHPSLRNDNIYISLLENHLPDIANIPWARINRAPGGETVNRVSGLRKNYHDYTRWTKNELRDYLEKTIDPDWFGSLGIFNPDGIKSMKRLVQTSNARVGRINDIWLWLAGLRIFFERLESSGKKIVVPEVAYLGISQKNVGKKDFYSNGTLLLKGNSMVNETARCVRTSVRKIERKRLQKKFMKLYPPVKI